jgi:hypothetical protein
MSSKQLQWLLCQSLPQVQVGFLKRVAHADGAIRQGEQDQTIGWLLDIDEYLENALALSRAAIAEAPCASPTWPAPPCQKL